MPTISADGSFNCLFCLCRPFVYAHSSHGALIVHHVDQTSPEQRIEGDTRATSEDGQPSLRSRAASKGKTRNLLRQRQKKFLIIDPANRHRVTLSMLPKHEGARLYLSTLVAASCKECLRFQDYKRLFMGLKVFSYKMLR